MRSNDPFGKKLTTFKNIIWFLEGKLDAFDLFTRAKNTFFMFGFLQLFRVLTRKNPNFFPVQIPDPKKPEL